MKELEDKVRTAINLKYPKSKVYKLFEAYEDAYALIKDPNPVQQNAYIELYFHYLNYMNRKNENNSKR